MSGWDEVEQRCPRCMATGLTKNGATCSNCRGNGYVIPAFRGKSSASPEKWEIFEKKEKESSNEKAYDIIDGLQWVRVNLPNAWNEFLDSPTQLGAEVEKVLAFRQKNVCSWDKAFAMASPLLIGIERNCRKAAVESRTFAEWEKEQKRLAALPKIDPDLTCMWCANGGFYTEEQLEIHEAACGR